MKEIVIVSGKGGVGKTTLSASLSFLFSRNGKKIVAVDADVDAPNLLIALGDGKEKYRYKIKISKKAYLDKTKCVNCGRCISACQFGAIYLDLDGKPLIAQLLCEGCGTCKIICPTNAIDIVEAPTGEIIVKKTKYGFNIITGNLEIGEHNSGCLVTLAKDIGHKEAEKEGAEIIVIDGAPGIGCPVISSIRGADYVIAVTEPTPASKNNLERIIKVVEHFNIPVSVVINKANISEDYNMELKSFITQELKIPILAEIPFDKSVIEAVNNMKPVVEYNPNSEASISIVNLFEKVSKLFRE